MAKLKFATRFPPTEKIKENIIKYKKLKKSYISMIIAFKKI
ncbi:hypothetical protein [Clostridium sporogenes]|nr:hypothetical protein [Clostridium sporogenes]